MIFPSFYVPSNYSRALARLAYLFYCTPFSDVDFCWTLTMRLALLVACVLRNLVDVVQKSKFVLCGRKIHFKLLQLSLFLLAFCVKTISALLIILKYMHSNSPSTRTDWYSTFSFMALMIIFVLGSEHTLMRASGN